VRDWEGSMIKEFDQNAFNLLSYGIRSKSVVNRRLLDEMHLSGCSNFGKELLDCCYEL